MKSPKKSKPVHPKATVTFRHNVLPPLMGVLAFFGIMGLLNGQWIEAQVQYHFIPIHTASTARIIAKPVDPNASSAIIIPSIGVDTPFVTSETSYDPDRVEAALRNGIVHYGATALPGQAGNVVALGHSSGSLWSQGHYKYAFTLLDKLQDKALVYINYKGVRYIYRVHSREVVDPSDVAVLDQTRTPELTMITCSPVGVSTHRLVIHAAQISPNPVQVSAPTKSSAQSATTEKLPQ